MENHHPRTTGKSRKVWATRISIVLVVVVSINLSLRVLSTEVGTMVSWKVIPIQESAVEAPAGPMIVIGHLYSADPTAFVSLAYYKRQKPDPVPFFLVVSDFHLPYGDAQDDRWQMLNEGAWGGFFPYAWFQCNGNELKVPIAPRRGYYWDLSPREEHNVFVLHEDLSFSPLPLHLHKQEQVAAIRNLSSQDVSETTIVDLIHAILENQ